MAAMVAGGVAEAVAVELFDDHTATVTNERVTPELHRLFGYASAWAEQAQRNDPCRLTFSSMLAAMMASDLSLCRWLQRHLGLRGVQATSMTKNKRINFAPVEGQLPTSASFRTAWAAARKLCPDGDPTDVRHFMAAYAICPDYHLLDFLRLRIDRRAWCLELAGHLQERYPQESQRWRAYATLAPAVPPLEFNTDAPVGRDLLNIDREVEAFSRLVAARATDTPLSIGVFGAWGSGKSFFMRRVRDRVARLAELGRFEGRTSAFHGQVAQVEFNAWHYSEGSLIASLVDHIFRNLRIGVEDEDDATLRRRSNELVSTLDRALQGLADEQTKLERAEAREAAAEQRLTTIEQRIPAQILTQQRDIEAAQRSVDDAQAELAEAEQRQRAELERAVAGAPVRAAAEVLLTGISDPNLATAAAAVRDLVGQAQGLRARWVPILIGLGVLAIGVVASLIIGSQTWAWVISAATAIGAVATAAGAWLKKLNEIARKGEEFQQAQANIAAAAAAAVRTEHQPMLNALAATLAARIQAKEASVARLAALVASPEVAREELDRLEQERAQVRDERARAVAEVAAQRQALAALGGQSLLGEFLDDRSAAEGYRKNLTIFTQVRNDFERLSKLMARANREYLAEEGKPSPTVSRIVLYIDDLDRCPEDKVIEVLRTVHLLLAFPLFVCVVAVDPRWVSVCLRKAPGLLHADGWQVSTGSAGTRAPADMSGTAQLLDDTFGKPATPADYLEKIFQIPLWLRPVPAAQRPDIVRTLLDPQLGEPAGPPAAMIAAPVITEHAHDQDEEVAALAAAMAPHAPRTVVGVDRRAVGATERAPADVTIDAVELDYISQLGSLLDGNPRALKRFVNTYRLVKSALSDVELAVFRSQIQMLGDTGGAHYLPYQLCLAQLAVICTQRDRALRMVRLADKSPGTFGVWLDQVQQDDADLAEFFRAALPTGSPDPSKISFETFALWLERTRRYSFYL